MSKRSDRSISRIGNAIFGGDPRENARRYNANAELRSMADLTMPWTMEALMDEVEGWLIQARERYPTPRI